jgi:hypothetical protein
MTPATSLNSIKHSTCSPLAHEMKRKPDAMFASASSNHAALATRAVSPKSD